VEIIKNWFTAFAAYREENMANLQLPKNTLLSRPNVLQRDDRPVSVWHSFILLVWSSETYNG